MEEDFGEFMEKTVRVQGKKFGGRRILHETLEYANNPLRHEKMRL